MGRNGGRRPVGPVAERFTAHRGAAGQPPGAPTSSGAVRSRQLIAVAAGAILLATFLPWGDRFGHTVNGWKESGTVIALGEAGASSPLRWLAMTWYGIPMAAAGVWFALGITRSPRRAVRTLAGLTVLLTGVSVSVHAATAGRLPVAGALVVCLAAAGIEVEARRTPSGVQPRRVRRGR